MIKNAQIKKHGDCQKCRQKAFLDNYGIAHHLTEDGLVDHDKDIEHVALLPEEPAADE